jgi:hypothetical protein
MRRWRFSGIWRIFGIRGGGRGVGRSFDDWDFGVNDVEGREGECGVKKKMGGVEEGEMGRRTASSFCWALIPLLSLRFWLLGVIEGRALWTVVTKNCGYDYA